MLPTATLSPKTQPTVESMFAPNSSLAYRENIPVLKMWASESKNRFHCVRKELTWMSGIP